MFSNTRPIREASQDTPRDIFELLFYLGWFDFAVKERTDEQRDLLWSKLRLAADMSSEIWESAIKAYQLFCGLTADGEFGSLTKGVLNQRFCCVPDKIHPSEARGGKRKWPQDRLTFAMVFDASHVPFSKDMLDQTIEHTIESWNNVCGVLLETYEEGDPGPNIYAHFRRIDGGSGTLAWSMLAYVGMPSSSQLEQRFDNTENWYFNRRPATNRGINIAAVSAHEMGHALGLEHISTNFATALMNPIYNPKIVVPQPADIDVVRGYFGEPAPTPVDPVDPTPVDPVDPGQPTEVTVNQITITLNGKEQKLIPAN